MPPSAGRTRSSLPTIHADAFPTAHSSAPDEECQGGKANWPPHPEAQDNQRDPGRFPQFVKPCNNWHVAPHSQMLITFTLLQGGARPVKASKGGSSPLPLGR